MIRFRQLEAFRSLMMTGTSVGAARKMHITQPAISRLIADLEADIGFRLFNRAKGRMEPTMAGVRFYKAVEENFLGLERLKQAAEGIRNEAPEAFTVACMPVMATSMLPLVLREFAKLQHDVPIKVDSSNVAEILVGLQDMKADVALSLAFPAIAGIEVEPLLEMPVQCALPAGHPLTSKAVIKPQDLHGQDMIGWFPSGPHSYVAEQMVFENAGIKPNYVIKTHTSHTRYAMVANGLGVAIVEPFAAKLWLAHGVVLRPFESDIRYKYVLSYPSNGSRSELVHDFRNAVLKVVENYDFGG